MVMLVLKKMAVNMTMIIFMLNIKLMCMIMISIRLMMMMMMRYYLIKGHSGGADGHSISSSLGVGSFAPVRLLVKDDHHQEGGWLRLKYEEKEEVKVKEEEEE